MEYSSLSGGRYLLGKQIGKGGEAKIFDVINYNSAVAKLYNAELCTSCREQKLKVLLQIPIDPILEEQVAFPRDILYQNGRFVGFVMRKIFGGVSLDALCRDESFDMRKRITVAQNLCALLNDIHHVGLIVGDLNPFNILVIPSTGMVRLIDVDSWHVLDHNKVYRCEVCIPEYTSPAITNRMTGQTLKTADLPTFSKESDIYSLSVLIFMLLMNGTYPFAVGLARGNKAEEAPQPVELMREYRFPYTQCPAGCRLPVYGLPYKVLSPRLQAMFSKIFSQGDGVSIERWFDSLHEFEKEIGKTCKDNEAHKFREGLYKCPYCTVARNQEKFLKKLRNEIV